MFEKNLILPPLSPATAPNPVLRIRLAASVTLYGGALGAAAILIVIIARTGKYEEAEHLTLIPALFSALTGAVAALLVTPLAIYHARDRANEASGLLIWLLLGLGFGLGSSFVTGLLIPLSVVFISLTEGVAGVGELPSLAIEAALRGIRSFYVEGALAIYTWLLAGALFGVGAWIIDRLNASPNRIASKYVIWAVSLSLGLAIVAFAAFGPPETLRNFG